VGLGGGGQHCCDMEQQTHSESIAVTSLSGRKHRYDYIHITYKKAMATFIILQRIACFCRACQLKPKTLTHDVVFEHSSELRSQNNYSRTCKLISRHAVVNLQHGISNSMASHAEMLLGALDHTQQRVQIKTRCFALCSNVLSVPYRSILALRCPHDGISLLLDIS